MKIQLNKKKLKNLSLDNQVLPNGMTPQIGGGTGKNSNTCTRTNECEQETAWCDPNSNWCGGGGTGGGGTGGGTTNPD